MISYPKKNRHLRFQVMAAFDRYPCSLPLIANVLSHVSERCVPALAVQSICSLSKAFQMLWTVCQSASYVQMLWTVGGERQSACMRACIMCAVLMMYAWVDEPR